MVYLNHSFNQEVFLLNFTHAIMSEFQDDERWAVIFTRKSFICCLGAFGVSVLLTKLTEGLFFTMIPGIVLGVILLLATYTITTFKFSSDDYLKGGGLSLDIYLINRIYRKQNTCLYMLGYGNDEEV